MDAQEQAYYASYRCEGSAAGATPAPLCTQFGVEVCWAGDERGKIVRATRAIAAGDVVWVEDPVVGMAHLSSRSWRSGEQSCARCLRPLGTLQMTWARIDHAVQEEAAAARRKRAKKGASKGKGKKSAAAAAAEPTAPVVADAASVQLQLPASLPFLSHDAAPPSDPLVLHLPLPSPVPCVRGCGSGDSGQTTMYCSLQCRDSDFAHSHEMLCAATAAAAPDSESDSSAAASSSSSVTAAAVAKAHAALVKYAQSHNEIFLVAAQVLVHSTLRALRAMRALPSVRKLLDLSSTAAASDSDSAPHPQPLLPFAAQLYARMSSMSAADRLALQSELRSCAVVAGAPYDSFCGALWWEHVEVPAHVVAASDGGDDGGEEEAEYRQMLCGVVEQALGRMGELAQAQLHHAARSSSPSSSCPSEEAVPWDEFLSALCLEDLWSLPRLGRVLSSFERNNIGWAAPTTLGLYVAHIRALDDVNKNDAVQRMGGEAVWQALQQRCDGASPANQNIDGAAAAASADDGGALASSSFASIEGTGLFVIGCCMNHSCDPNVSLRPKRANALEEKQQHHAVATEFDDDTQRAKLLRLMASNPASAASAASASSAVADSAPSSSSSSSLPLSAHHHVSGPSVLLDRSALFVALRPIAPGDELNISYIDLLQPKKTKGNKDGADGAATAGEEEQEQLEEVPRHSRQKQLEAYGFTCACAKCVREGAAPSA